MSEDYESVLKTEIESLAGAPIPDNDTNFFETNILDSLNIINLVVFVENTFSVSIDPLDVNLENFGSINKIATYIKENKN